MAETKPKKKAEVPANFLVITVELDGVTKTVADWCADFKIDPFTVYRRRHRMVPWREALKVQDNKRTWKRVSDTTFLTRQDKVNNGTNKE